jgi:thermospermine synthase
VRAMSLESKQRCNGFYYEEMVTTTLFLKSELKSIGFNSESPFQRVQIIETDPFGKTLVIDDHTQSAACDEHVYHEALVHPVLLAHGNPKTVFIGGGGEGATAREILRWKSVEKLVMCDIDEVACKMCQQHVWIQTIALFPKAMSYHHYRILFSASGME